MKLDFSSQFHAIRRCGECLVHDFERLGFQEQAFCELAQSAIEDHRLAEMVSSELIWAQFFSSQTMWPKQFQPNGRFGQPPVTLFAHERFVIDAYFWHTATTSIHDHGFSGAFAVVEGSSLHARYSFKQTQTYSDFVSEGTLSQDDFELLKVGDIRPIQSGNGFIHSVFHLENPSLSLCVRTTGESAELLPQREYHPSGLARVSHVNNQRLALLPRLLALGLEYEPRMVLDQLRESATAYTPLEIWRFTDTLASFFGNDLAFADSFLDALPSQLASYSNRLKNHYQYLSRENRLTALRHTVEDPEQRLVLGLLVNAISEKQLRHGIRLAFAAPDDPQGINRFVSLVNDIGTRDGRPNPEAIVSGFGLSAEDSEALGKCLSSGNFQKVDAPLSLQENLSFRTFFEEDT